MFIFNVRLFLLIVELFHAQSCWVETNAIGTIDSYPYKCYKLKASPSSMLATGELGSLLKILCLLTQLKAKIKIVQYCKP